MHDYRRIVDTIGVICFMIALAAFVAADRYLVPMLSGGDRGLGAVVVLALSSFGLFALVFRVLLWAYARYIHVVIFPIYNLSGEWHHLLTIESSGSTRNGITNITSDVNGVTFSGQHLRSAGTLSSTWQSDAVVVVARRITIVFTSEGASRPVPMTHGAIVLNVIGTPPSELSGTWSDMAPGVNLGTIRLFRSKDLRDSELRKFNSHDSRTPA